MKPVSQAIDANRAFSIIAQIKVALLAVEGRSLFLSGGWEDSKREYEKLIQEWPITEIGFHRERTSGFWKIIGLLVNENRFVLKLEDAAFLVNIFRIFNMDRSIAAWSISKAEEADFKETLLAQSLEPEGSSTQLWGDLMQFAPNLFWFHLLEDIGYDEPFLCLHCGEKVPRALKQIISDNNLEPYIKYAANH